MAKPTTSDDELVEILKCIARAHANRAGPSANACDFTEWMAASRIAKIAIENATLRAQVDDLRQALVDVTNALSENITERYQGAWTLFPDVRKRYEHEMQHVLVARSLLVKLSRDEHEDSTVTTAKSEL